MQVEESSELARFREEWRAEVRARTSVNDEPKSPQPAEASHDSPTPPNAVELYRRAAQAEEQGMLDEALALYRRAFRREPNVDRLFQREETARVKTTSSSTTRDNLPPAPSITTEVDAITQQLRESNVQLSSGGSLELQAVLSTFPDELMFISQDEQTTSPLQVLPLEVIVDILMKLAYRGDTNAIERFAIVCRKARAITLDPHIWRYLVKNTYVPPQVQKYGIQDVLVKRFKEDYRQFYIEHPRLRMDGVYIAVCHYVRTGLSENAWITVSHLITYHRYLRFFPDGVVLSLLANEHENPQAVVQTLQPDLHMKGFMKGKWYLDGSTVHVTDLVDPSLSRYTFQMVLSLKSRPLGRWNKLDLIQYDSVAVETGEVSPFMLKHERPFWFSKVRSY